MKKLIISTVAVFTLAGGGLAYSNLGMASVIYPLNENIIEIHESADGKENDLLIKIDNNGFFFSEVLKGEDVGSFEAWDGKKFYRYSKEYNDLLIVNHPEDGSKVIAHPFLSEIINDRISQDIVAKKMKKDLFSSKYKKTTSRDQEVEEIVEFNNKENYPQKYTMNVDDQEVLSYEILEVKDLIEELDVQKYINLEQLLDNNVKITEVDQIK